LNDTSPTSPDAINPIYLAERLTALLGRTANKVGDVSVHPLKTGTSGDQLYRVEPRADGQPFSLILKLNRSEDIAETLFYRDLCPRAGIDTPRVLDARVLTDGGGWLLMEELKPKDDLSWTEEDYRAVVSDMARMHARYLNSPELDTYPWLWRPTPGALAEITGGLALLAQALRASPVPSLVSVYSEERLDRIAAVLARSDEIIGPLVEAGVTLVHGDYWFHNVLLTDEGRRAVIDWQGCRVFSGTWEICYFVDLLQAVGPDEYRELPVPEERITAWYFEALRAHNVELSKEHFEELYLRARVLQPLLHWFRLVGMSLLAGGYAPGEATVRFLEREFQRWDADVEALNSC
jgi:hypothetical protein